MAVEAESNPSFSPYRKWAIGLNVGLVVIMVFAVVVMVNYLSRDYYLRLQVSTQSKVKLFPRTVKFLETLTNAVKVIVYYDKDEPFYSTIVELLNQYRTANPRVSIRTVDYNRDPGAAQLLNSNYSSILSSPSAKNLIIFDGGDNRIKPVDGNTLAQYILEQVPNEKEREFRRKPTLFEGERAFTSTLIAVTSPKPLKAYFLQGHGEHPIDSDDDQFGYRKFAFLLRAENYIQVEPLSLLDTNHPVPADCNLLVVAGPRRVIEEPELDMIDQYLTQGGRLLAMFTAPTMRPGETGLEKILAKWGVNVSSNIITDPERHIGDQDVIVASFSKHPIVNPLLGFQLHLIQPRAVGKLRSNLTTADAPNVDEIAFSGPKSYFAGGERNPPRAYPLMVAVEKSIKGVITERGTTRMVVVGDSIFLANHQIDSAANRDFAGFAVNWLLDRPQLVEGIGPRPVKEYRLVMTNSQMQSAQWILLACMPGSVLLLGGVVWLRRRS